MNKRIEKYFEELEKQRSIPVLSDNQIGLIKILAMGESVKNSAIILNTNYNTLQKHIQNIYKAFKVNSRLELITKALDFKFICYSDIKHKFRKRFVYKKNDEEKESESLNWISYKKEQIDENFKDSFTKQEIDYLNLVAKGYTKKQIIKELKLYNMHFCNVLGLQICGKLNAKNIIQAVIYAFLLKIID